MHVYLIYVRVLFFALDAGGWNGNWKHQPRSAVMYLIKMCVCGGGGGGRGMRVGGEATGLFKTLCFMSQTHIWEGLFHWKHRLVKHPANS